MQSSLYKDVRVLLLSSCLLFGTSCACSDEVRIAVASNFSLVAAPLSQVFTKTTGHEIILSHASTGKLYAQIVNGAPFDIFLAADVERPLKLETDLIAVPGTRFTYAYGQLVLWSSKKSIDVEMALRDIEFRHFAIANEKLAPYGRAAMEYLSYLGLWDDIQKRLVRGENVNQAFQFVNTESAQLGLVARAQAKNREGTLYLVPESHYSAIQQQAVLLQDKPAARMFVTFLQSSEGRTIIKNHGYLTP